MVSVGGEGRGGYPGFVSLQVPTSEAAVSADTHALARLLPRNFFEGRFCEVRAQAPGSLPACLTRKASCCVETSMFRV